MLYSKDKIIHRDSCRIIAKDIDGEIILIPQAEDSGGEKLFCLSDDLSISIWNLINGKRSIEDIIEAIFDEFNAEREQIESDLLKFLQELEKIGAIKIETK